MISSEWRTASGCDSAECVEVAVDDGRVQVRDSKLGDVSPIIEYTAAEWRQLLDYVRAVGRLADVHPLIRPWPEGKGWCWERGGVHLHFDDAEMDAFVVGCRAGDFDLEPAHA